MKRLSTVAMLILSASPVLAGDLSVRLSPDEGAKTVAVSVGGEAFAIYNYSDELPKPFFSPVRGPGGTIMSRPIAKPGDDHPHHKGIWLAVDEVNEVDFWAERGKIGNVSVSILNSEGNPAEFEVLNNWLDGQGSPVVTERTKIRVFINRLIAYDITFRAEHGRVTFADTKEGLFGFRMVDSMREREGGHVVNADGREGAGACWGRVSNWVDYYGEIDGKTFGVAIFDHPLNFRRSRYHVRNYGLFSISPFGEQAYTQGRRPPRPAILPNGSELRLRYAMYFHSGDTQAADVAGTYREYLQNFR